MVTQKKQVQEVKGAKKHGILTEQQRKHLTSKKTTEKSIEKIRTHLNKVFPELFDDLKIIKNSEHLLRWRSFHSNYDLDWKFKAETLSEMFWERERLYLECIMSFIGKDRRRYFWLDPSAINKKSKINQRSLKKNYLFRKLRYDYKPDEAILEKSFDLNILPHEKENAITLQQIKRAVKEGKYNSQFPVNDKKIKESIETEFYKLWLDIRPEWDIIVKKGKKRGFLILRKLPKEVIYKQGVNLN
jgi:hypothetical protein